MSSQATVRIVCNRYVFLLLSIICSIRRLAAQCFRKLFHLRKTVLIMKYDGLGDMIIWLPYAVSIREHYPSEKYHILMCCLPQNREFIEKFHVADSIICFPCYKNKYQWLLLKILFFCRYHFDIVINAACPRDVLTYHPEKSCTTLYFAAWSAFDQRYNYFDKLIYADDKSIYERYDAILEYLDIPYPPINKSPVICSEDFPMMTVKNYIVICAGASTLQRCWEEEKFIDLIDRLIVMTEKTVVLVGMKSEYKKNEKIRTSCKHHSKIINLAGKTSVMELFSVVQKGSFLISNDTGTAHVAGVVGTLSFVICGGQDYGAFFPYPSEVEGKRIFSIFCKDQRCFQCRFTNSKCNMRTPYPCISAISVEQVFSTISEVLKIPEQKALL